MYPVSLALRITVFLSTAFICLAQTEVVRGLVDRCSSARCIDADSVIDSIRVDVVPSALPPYVCIVTMKAAAGIGYDTTQVNLDGSSVGLMQSSAVRLIGDTLLVVLGKPLSAFYRNNVIQVVYPVVADTIVVDSMCYPTPWDGVRGGIIALDAREALVGRGTISVSGMGYRGGKRSNNGGSCGVVQACDPETSDRTGGKGESIVLEDPTCRNGHLPWYSGGGGGDAHNAGGGGGGNGGSGGRGGDQFVCNPPPGMWGIGGAAASSASPRRILMGGGGGGGHQNNSASTNGGAGGGVVIIRTRQILGDSLIVDVRGQSVSQRAGNDGGGGGGAGGTVLLDACYTDVPVSVDVSGGRGGDCDGGHGPGGGGAGGRVIIHPTLLQSCSDSLQLVLNGGQSGLAGADPRAARPGQPGTLLTLCDSIKPHTLFYSKHNNVGDTIHLQFEPADTLARCATDILHRLQLIGHSYKPLTDRLSFFDNIGLSIEHILPDTTTISFVLPSTRRWELPLLTVLSTDSVTMLQHRSSVAQLEAFPSCTWFMFPDVLTADACAQRLRLINQQPSNIVRTSVSNDQLEVMISSSTNEHLSITMYSALGELLFADGEWNTSKQIDMTSRGAGLYLIKVDGQQWSSIIPVMYRSY